MFHARCGVMRRRWFRGTAGLRSWLPPSVRQVGGEIGDTRKTGTQMNRWSPHFFDSSSGEKPRSWIPRQRRWWCGGGGGYLGCFLSASEVSLARIPGQPRRLIASRWRQSKYLKAKQAWGEQALRSATGETRRNGQSLDGEGSALPHVCRRVQRRCCRLQCRVMKHREGACESPQRAPLFTGSCCNTSALLNFHSNMAKHNCIIFWENKARGSSRFFFFIIILFYFISVQCDQKKHQIFMQTTYMWSWNCLPAIKMATTIKMLIFECLTWLANL